MAKYSKDNNKNMDTTKYELSNNHIVTFIPEFGVNDLGNIS